MNLGHSVVCGCVVIIWTECERRDEIHGEWVNLRELEPESKNEH